MLGLRSEQAVPPVSGRELRWRSYLAQIAAGEAQALAQLYDECASTLLGLALRMMKNNADAEEIILDVFQQVWRTAPTFNPERGTVLRWLTLLVRSRAIDRLRTSAAKHFRDTLTIDKDWEVASREPTPDRASMFKEESALIRAALLTLPGDQRQAVELAYFSGLTHVEIATKLGVPLGTIKTRIRAAMDKLRDSLTRGGLSMAEIAR